MNEEVIEDVIRAGNYLLIDVREPMELDMEGEIDGATNIPLGEIQAHEDEIKNFDGNIIFFCRSGGRAGKAVEFFTEEGLTNVFNGGGFEALQILLDENKQEGLED